MARNITPSRNFSLQLRTWLALQTQRCSLAERAEALRQVWLSCPQVNQALYLHWQSALHCYQQEGGGTPLPPGFGDPLSASDSILFERLQSQPQLPLETLRRLPCWLGGRLRRAGISHGQAIAMQLMAEQHGLLLIELEPGADPAWPTILQQSLLTLLDQQLPTTSSALLGNDPQPALIFDATGEPQHFNAALAQLLGESGSAQLEQHLPINYRQLVQASLTQRRAIEDVEREVGGHLLLWQFIPDVSNAEVIARCREAATELHTVRDARRAQRLYRLITENTTDLISRHAPDGRVLDASGASWTLLGYWPETLHGQAAQALFHPQDRKRLLDPARDALLQDGYHTMTFRVRHRDGHYLWFETASRAIRETYTGEVVEIISVSRDITARVMAEENRRRLAGVVEANTDLVLFITQAGQLTYANPSARRALGLADDALPELAQLLNENDLARLLDDGWPTAEQAGDWSAEMSLRSLADASLLPVSLVLLSQRSASGERYFSLVARDMTERELREAQQRRHQDEMAHTARLVTLGEMASGIAHEINQPLAAIVNYANASQRYLQGLTAPGKNTERLAQGLARITEHANHAAEVIRRLRAFLRKGVRRQEAIDIAAVINATVQLCQWEISAAQVSLEYRLEPDLPAIYADPVLIGQVLLNLLRNAIEANREQHPDTASLLRLSAKLQDGWLCLGVEDQGPGADAQVLARMFTPFYTRKANGLGLGLSMSRSIVEGYGGSLEAHSATGGGLYLECRLPPRIEPLQES